MTMSAVDFLDQWFETDVLKATMSASGIIGTFLGVRSPGTAYVLLHHYMGEIDGAFRSWGLSRGGTGAISNAIADAAREAGAEIRTEAPIAKIVLKNGEAKGVALENGDELYADVISSSVDPRLTFMKMVGEEQLPADFVEDIKRYKFRGSSGKVNLALDALPNFKAMPGAGPHLRGAVSISPSVDYMERAYDDAKYGRFSRHPYIDIVSLNITMEVGAIAPPGKHVMSCFVQYAPYNLKEGNWDEKRDEFGDTVIDTIAEHAPNIKDIILHRQVVTPLDLTAREYSLLRYFMHHPGEVLSADTYHHVTVTNGVDLETGDRRGVWRGAGPLYRFNIAQDLETKDIQPWAEELFIKRVRDNGLGIPPEQLPDIFKLFAQADVNVSGHVHGLGIGLSLVQQMVLLHGGEVSAYSTGISGEGAEFVVRLPASGPPR